MMIARYIWERFCPTYLILITISILVSPSFSAERKMRHDVITMAHDENKSLAAFPSDTRDTIFAQDVDGSTNVPIGMCDSSQQSKYADLTTAHLTPPCEKAFQGYCGIRRNQNYTLITKFISKVLTKSLSVRVTTLDPNFGWETQLWPEFSVCSADFNITCPQSPNNLVQAVLHRALPEGFPAMRSIVRIRLFGTDENDIKRVYICRQINLQVY